MAEGYWYCCYGYWGWDCWVFWMTNSEEEGLSLWFALGYCAYCDTTPPEPLKMTWPGLTCEAVLPI